MHNRIEEIISRLGKKKITQSDFTQLLKYAKSISLKKYPTINEYDREEIVGSVLKSTFFALSSAQIENANRHAYFLRILHSKFCDYFRKQPDASIFRQIQAVLNGDIFVSQPKNQTNWSFRWWRPAQWKKPAQKAGADIIETLLNNLATFSEADIEINLSEKKGFSLPEESIIAYLLYTYSYSEDFFGQRLAFRAEDLKHIIESRLWMVSRINPSIDYEESSNKEKYDWPDQATVGNLGYSSSYLSDVYNSAIKVEKALVKELKKDPKDLRLWMLYMRAIAPKAGVLILEKELLKTYPKIAQIHHSRLAQKWHETAELVKKWMQESIDLSFCGARDVVVDVLGKHFSKFM